MGAAGFGEHERNRHHHQGTGSQGTDSFGNPQAPISGTGRSAYNADGVPVSTTKTSLVAGSTTAVSGSSEYRETSTGSGNRGSDYHDNRGSDHRDNRGSDYRDNRGSDYRDSDNQNRGGITSYIPGTQAYKDARRDDNNSYGSNQDRDNYSSRGRTENYGSRDESGSDRRRSHDASGITAGQHSLLHLNAVHLM